MNQFAEDLMNLDARARSFSPDWSVGNGSGCFAIFVGDILIKSSKRKTAGEMDDLLDVFAEIGRAEDEYEDREPYDYEPDYPDFGPPGSGAVITEYTGFEPGLWPEE